MKLQDIHIIYFIGIGGIGMSALAKYFHEKGVEVSGYDRTPSEMTDELQSLGIDIHFEEDLNKIPADAGLVVYTPAIPKQHKELVYFQQHNYTVVKRSDVLQMITEQAFTIAVAGTHGKTTTSSMIAHILNDTGYGCTAFLGGVAQNFKSNYIGGREDVMVVEADEFDRSFLKLNPSIAIVTAVDPDHLDIYGNAQELENNFYQFTQKITTNGVLIAKDGLAILKDIKNTPVLSYSLNSSSSFARSENMRVEEGAFHFDYVSKKGNIRDIELKYPGIHNVENSIAAITVAKHLEIQDDKIKKAISGFIGIHRRFEYIIRSEDFNFIDDYAHHPVEIKAFLRSVRLLYPQKRITAVFQPHLYSRTRDFADGFAESLELADQVILLPIYPAREEPIEGVESEMIYKKMDIKEKYLSSKDELIPILKKLQPEVLLTIGAGDIDRLVNPIKEAFES